MMNQDEQRLVPRFPIPKEKIKFYIDGLERIFAVRDISLHGLSISLLDIGETLLFPQGSPCEADLNLGEAPFRVNLKVTRVSAWSVGFVFIELDEEVRDRIRSFVDPLRIATSLRKVDKGVDPIIEDEKISAWYHGDSGTDFYLWNDPANGLGRALLCVGNSFWEWHQQDGVSTGQIEHLEGANAIFHRDPTPDPRKRSLARKVLEHAEVMDYRLVSFLKDKT